MEIGKYEVFLQVAEMGNLTHAAESLGYTQSAVSRIITDLEKEWDIQLLLRGRNGAKLTTAGTEILPQIRAVCNAQHELDERISQLHGLTCGTVRVGSFPSTSIHWLPKIIKTFQEQYPTIQFEVINQIEYRGIVDMLEEGRVDCGFVALPCDADLETIFLHRDRHMAVIPENHPLAKARSYPIARFAEDPFIKLEDDRDGEFMEILERCHVKPNIRYRGNDDYTIMSLVENGLGVSSLTELMLHRTPFHVVVRPLDPPQYREIGLAARSFDDLSPCAKCFVDYVEAWVRQERSSLNVE